MARIIKHIPGHIQDGKLDFLCGRIVIYAGYIVVTYGPSSDHNYLLRALASRFRINKDEVISRATRLYWKIEDYGISISGVRKIDDEDYASNAESYEALVREKLKKHI